MPARARSYREKMFLTLLIACDSQPEVAPPPPAVPTEKAEAPEKPVFDCKQWSEQNHIAGGMCSESPHLPGLWMIQPGSGGSTRFVATRSGRPVKGGGGAVAAFLREAAPWDHPVTRDDIGGVLSAFGSYPPGFQVNTPSEFEAPFTYTLTTSIADWRGHGGPNAVAGAMPTGPQMRATLSGGPVQPIQWVLESGSGSTWSPAATIQWDRVPKSKP